MYHKKGIHNYSILCFRDIFWRIVCDANCVINTDRRNLQKTLSFPRRATSTSKKLWTNEIRLSINETKTKLMTTSKSGSFRIHWGVYLVQTVSFVNCQDTEIKRVGNACCHLGDPKKWFSHYVKKEVLSTCVQSVRRYRAQTWSRPAENQVSWKLSKEEWKKPCWTFLCETFCETPKSGARR